MPVEVGWAPVMCGSCSGSLVQCRRLDCHVKLSQGKSVSGGSRKAQNPAADSLQAPQGCGSIAKVSEIPMDPAAHWGTACCRQDHI